MKIAYFDCFSGASGDMILGSLLDAGLPIERLKSEIALLHLSHYDIQVEKVIKKGIAGSQAIIQLKEDHFQHHHRHLHDIEEIIKNSELDECVKEKSIAIFKRLAEAEAKVHHTSVNQIHFHEIGAMDAIIDVVGAVAGIHAMGIEKLFCSAIHVGCGTVTCAHGVLPVPAPATAELIQGVPIYSTGITGELLTPTGAAILTTLSAGFGIIPPMKIEKIGYGAGTSEFPIPNLLRIMIGQDSDIIKDYKSEQIGVIETTIDDMNPQIYDYLFEKLFDAGAIDVFLTHVQMKKNRPGTMVTIICSVDQVGKISDILLRETTSIGLRWRIDHRIKADRSIQEIHTNYGMIRCKIATVGNQRINIFPEYEDCKRIAEEKHIPLKEVMDTAKRFAYSINPPVV